VYAQAPSQAPANCGIETWSTDKMMYVTTPCTGAAPAGQEAKAPGAAKSATPCGIETWDTDKMMYVGTPCAATTTYENPSAKPSENFNSK